jgi:hypothetical protein
MYDLSEPLHEGIGPLGESIAGATEQETTVSVVSTHIFFTSPLHI